MEPPGPSEDAHAGKGPGSSTKRFRLELVDKMPDNPKRLVFESTQQRYEVPLRQDERLPSSPDARHSPSKTPAVAPHSRDHSHRRTHAAQRTVDRVPCNLKRVVFESSQERFEHHIRPEHVLPSAAGHDSDDDDFMPIPNTRSSSHIDKSKDVGPRKTRQTRAGLSTGACTEARQRKKRATSSSSIVNVRCNPRDVIFTTNLLNPQQYAAIEADGFGHLLRMKIDALENKNLLTWLLDHTDPDRMLIRIGAGKVLPITPQIISMVLGLPIRSQTFKQYSWKEGIIFRQQLISDLNQSLTEDCDIHISNLQQEILKGNVNPLMKRCFFMILCNRFLLPSSSNTIGSVDIKRTMDHQLFGVVDWSQAVFNDLQIAVRSWHDRDKNQLTQNIYGCAIFLLVYYLDNIDHPVSLVDRTSTPRLTFYDNALIDRLTVADTTITTQGAHAFGVQPFKPWSTTCYAAVDVRGAPCHNINVPAAVIPNLDIPRLLDLLFEPLDDLTGSHRDRVRGFFSEFDHTLSQNKRSIENSIANIVRAQFRLADQCRPFIHELVASQTRDTNIPGDTSKTMHTRNDHGSRESAHCTPPSMPGHEIYSHGSFVSAGTLLRSQIDEQSPVRNTPGPSSFNPTSPTGPFGSPVHCVVSPPHISEDLPRPSTAPLRTSSKDVSGSFIVTNDPTVHPNSPVHTPIMAPVRSTTSEDGSPTPSPHAYGFDYSPLFLSTMDQSSHQQSSSIVTSRTDTELVQNDPPLHRGRIIHPQGFSYTETIPTSSASHHSRSEHNSPYAPELPEACSNKTIGKDTTSALKWPILDDLPMFKFPGKRLTKKPSKFYSPFKHGILSRPPPNLQFSLRMHAFLCADDSPLKRKTLMHFGTESLTGRDITLSFGIGKFIDPVFMDAFVKCIAEDDFNVRPECHGFRIFLQPLVSDILKSDSFSIHKTQPQCSQDIVLETIKRCLPTTDLQKAKMIFLPVSHLSHWSVYCINLGQSRVDVLDSMNYTSNNEVTWDTYHSPMGQILMERLCAALSLAAPRKFPQFANWRRVPIRVPPL
ncbi:uncharacterized protein [Miscanthus floridulus]|uniref:uncharacterized protein isoform X3 n=1 Tax=Miscanthus floridulus TaxID=154761 RepID=UPI00345B114C